MRGNVRRLHHLLATLILPASLLIGAARAQPPAATTGVEEDKAEMFANLIVDFEYVENRARIAPVINVKVERLKELLVRFCPEMNDEFWERVRQIKRADK